MASKRVLNRSRPYCTDSKPEFQGYRRGYQPKTKSFRKAFEIYKLDERAIAMIKQETIEGSRMSSGMKAHRVGTEKLRELDFDPMDAMMQQLEEINGMITKELASKDPRAMVLTNLTSCKTRILETLLPYRYGKAPILTVESSESRDPIRIILETSSKSYDEEDSA